MARGASGNAAFDDLVNAVSSGIQSDDRAHVQSALNVVTALSPEAAPMIAEVQTDVVAQIFNVVGSRLAEKSNMPSEQGALWVQGMVATSSLDDSGSVKGYDADTNGFAMGLDANPAQAFKMGVGFAYNTTDVDGYLRDTDIDNMTAFLYGEYKPANWFVNGIVSYAWADYEESRHAAGTTIGAKYDVNTLGMQIMGGCEHSVAGMTIAPELGMRYFRISTDAYTDNVGSHVADNSDDVLTGVFGARMSKVFDISSTARIVPEARLAVTYDFVDADNNAFVTLANGSSYSVDGDSLSRFGVELGLGASAQFGENFSLSLSYQGAWRSDFDSHAGFLNAKQVLVLKEQSLKHCQLRI